MMTFRWLRTEGYVEVTPCTVGRSNFEIQKSKIKVSENENMKPTLNAFCWAKKVAGVYVLVVSVAQLVARRTHDRKVVGSIPTNAVCFTVVR